MPYTLLTTTDREEAMSRAYAYAVASGAGYVTATYDMDRDGVDLRIQSGGAMRPALELQLKATINLGAADDGFYHFPLAIRNYDLLRIETQTPRLLVVLDLPREQEQWMIVNAEELVLRRRAYWLNLRGGEKVANQMSVTVKIPASNVFNVENLRRLMEQSRAGRIP